MLPSVQVHVPGQYPLEDRPVLWAPVKSVGLYRPRSMTGENTI
jgi:hypothetical protein